MYKIIVQELRTEYAKPTLGEPAEKLHHYETTAQIESDYKEVVAGFLRAFAEKLDPTKVESRY